MREDYFSPLLPALVRFSQTFPPVCSKVTNILVELSRACSAGAGERDGSSRKTGSGKGGFASLVQKTFQELVETAIVKL